MCLAAPLFMARNLLKASSRHFSFNSLGGRRGREGRREEREGGRREREGGREEREGGREGGRREREEREERRREEGRDGGMEGRMREGVQYILVRHRVQGSTGFRTPRALGCSVPSVARALLRGQGVLNPVDPVDEASNWFRARTTIFIGRFKNLHSNEAFFT